MSTDAIQLPLYLPLPRLDVPSAVAVSAALLATVPPSAPPAVVKAGRNQRAATLALQRSWGERQLAFLGDKVPDPRLVDLRGDGAWGAMSGRLAAQAALPHDRYPRAKRAAALIAQLFPDGLGFLKLSYTSQWAECEKRLDLIKSQKLEAELDELAGPDFLLEVQASHEAYTAMVQEALRRTEARAVNLSDPLREAARTMTGYVTQVVAWAADDERPETVQAAIAALRPLEVFREQLARRLANRGAAATGTTTPELPEATPQTPLPEIA